MRSKQRLSTFVSRAVSIVFLFMASGYALGQTAKAKKTDPKVDMPREVPADAQAEAIPSLQLSEGISDRIYSRTTPTLTRQATGSLAIDSSVRLFFPKDFTLSNSYFTVPYAKSSKTLPGVMVGPQIPIVSLGNGQLNSLLHFGYAYTQGIIEADSDSGLSVKDAVELQWIPVQAGLEVVSGPLTSQKIKIGLTSTAGMDWYTQSGQLDGMNQTFWVPRYEVGSSLILFSQNSAESSGFDGIRLSGIYYRTFSTKQVNRGWAADIGAQYAF